MCARVRVCVRASARCGYHAKFSLSFSPLESVAQKRIWTDVVISSRRRRTIDVNADSAELLSSRLDFPKIDPLQREP